ncbi:MAG: PEP-CTERM sorting domain-containing protein [Candidatus Methylomirabilales bacterium]
MKRLIAFFTCVMGASLFAANAQATIIGTTGAVTEIAPPASVEVGALESDTVVSAFAESQNVSLSGNLLISFASPGTFTSNSPFPGGSILSGTIVNSYFLHFDPVGEPTNLVTVTGTVTFNEKILGVIAESPKLLNSDPLGASGTTYPPDLSGLNANRGLEGSSQATLDTVTLSANLRTLSLDQLVATLAPDQIRVITQPVPEPGTLLLIGSGLVGIGVGARRRRRS